MSLRTASTRGVRFTHTPRVLMGFVIFAGSRASCCRRKLNPRILQMAYLKLTIVKSGNRNANAMETIFGFGMFLTLSINDLRCGSGYTPHPNNAIQPPIPVYRLLFFVSCKQTPQLNDIYKYLAYKFFKMLYDVRIWCRCSVPTTTCQPPAATEHFDPAGEG